MRDRFVWNGKKIVFGWLGIEAKVPSFDSIRMWSCHVDIAQWKLVVRDGEAWIWLAGHSNQIGHEKVLQIIGIRVQDLPPVGKHCLATRSSCWPRFPVRVGLVTMFVANTRIWLNESARPRISLPTMQWN